MSQPMSPAREIAYDAFVQVMEAKRHPDEVVDELCSKLDRPLKRIDRNLVKEILYGSLRWYSKIYWILQNTSSRDLDGVKPEIRAALVLGTYQIFYMDRIPDRAAVNESVEYVRKRSQANAVNFVNGILRQIARRAQYFAKPDKNALPVEYLSLQFAHPQWIVARWIDMFGFERLEKMLAANNQPPPWTVRVNALKVLLPEVHKLQQQLLRDEKTHADRRPLRSSLLLREAPNLDKDSLFGQGYFTVQDEASQLIGHLVDPHEDEIIIDAAAGKSGKLSHLYELSGGKAKLTAVEKNPRQLVLGKEAMQRLGHPVDAVTWVESDFLDWKPSSEAEAPHKILLDSPCSGMGILRRHPEGKWHKNLALIKSMAELQKKLLTHAIDVLRPGGELVYSVCSFELEETTDQLAFIREKYGDKIELISPLPRLPDYYKRYVTRQNVFLVYAGNQDDMDGFGAFIIKKAP